MRSVAELNAMRDKARASIGVREDHDDAVRVLVGMGESGIEAGARDVLAVLFNEVAKARLEDVVVGQSANLGDHGPLPVVVVAPPKGEKIVHTGVTPEDAKRIASELIAGQAKA